LANGVAIVNLLSQVVLTSLIVLGCSTAALPATFTITTSFNSGADSLAIQPEYGSGNPVLISSYTTSVSDPGLTGLNLAGVHMTGSSAFSFYSSDFSINITIKEDGTDNVGRIILDDSMIASVNPNGSIIIYGYNYWDLHTLTLDPSSTSTELIDGRFAETTVGGTLFSLDLFTPNSYAFESVQASMDAADVYVEMYVQPSAAPEPSAALILASGLGIVFAANRCLKRKRILQSA
jgi:hypothetical protein